MGGSFFIVPCLAMGDATAFIPWPCCAIPCLLVFIAAPVVSIAAIILVVKMRKRVDALEVRIVSLRDRELSSFPENPPAGRPETPPDSPPTQEESGDRQEDTKK